MDPLSIGSAVVGLVAASSRISQFLYHFVTHTKDAPKSASQILDEMTSVTAALKQLQTYLTGASTSSVARRSLLSLRDIAATLTACVTTYSDLEHVVGKCLKGGKVKRMIWLINEGDVGELLQRVQAHKLSLTLMLTVLQCESIQEAQTSVNRLTDLMDRLVASSPDLQNRINTLETDANLLAPIPQSIGSQLSQSTDSFEADLQTSRVYQRVRGDTMWTPASSSRGSIAPSIFSNLTDLSIIPVLNLPIWQKDLSNAGHYQFGARHNLTVAAMDTRERKSPNKERDEEQIAASQQRTHDKTIVKPKPSIWGRELWTRQGAVTRRGAIKRPAKGNSVNTLAAIQEKPATKLPGQTAPAPQKQLFSTRCEIWDGITKMVIKPEQRQSRLVNTNNLPVTQHPIRVATQQWTHTHTCIAIIVWCITMLDAGNLVHTYILPPVAWYWIRTCLVGIIVILSGHITGQLLYTYRRTIFPPLNLADIKFCTAGVATVFAVLVVSDWAYTHAGWRDLEIGAIMVSSALVGYGSGHPLYVLYSTGRSRTVVKGVAGIALVFAMLVMIDSLLSWFSVLLYSLPYGSSVYYMWPYIMIFFSALIPGEILYEYMNAHPCHKSFMISNTSDMAYVKACFTGTCFVLGIGAGIRLFSNFGI